MAIKPGLRVSQNQRLALTPALMQSISVLQMSITDLNNLVSTEIAENPFLSVEPPNRFDSGADFQMALETVPHQNSLAQSLTEQISLTSASQTIQSLAIYLANDLNEGGYLSESMDYYLRHLPHTESELDQAVAVLQQCEPTGIGARDLRDCLDLQLKALGETEETRHFLTDYLKLFAAGQHQQLAKLTAVSLSEIKRLAEVLKGLNPSPGTAFGQLTPEFIIPDIQVARRPEGGFSVDMARGVAPTLVVDHDLQAGLQDRDPHVTAFANHHVDRAQALTRAIAARSKTILQVAQNIVASQQGFFESGPQALKPMTRSDLAVEMTVHPSTITRAVANKALECEFGTFPFAYFFTSSLGAISGDAKLSAQVVRLRIQKLIKGEPPSNPYADDTITTLLRESGVDISRRTVAKYRQCLNIPTSAKRRVSK